MQFNLDFDGAAEKVKHLNKKPDDDELLKVYGLYKQATIGNVDASRPSGWLDFKGKAKWDSWNSYKGLGKVDAKTEYVKFVEFLIIKYN